VRRSQSSANLKSAIEQWLALATSLTKPERGFLERWLAESKDPLWKDFAEKSGGEFTHFVNGPFAILVGCALGALRTAERAKIGPTAL
jgi:hypothetical protein